MNPLTAFGDLMKKIAFALATLFVTGAAVPAAGFHHHQQQPALSDEDRADALVGAWTVWESGIENRSIKLTFEKHRKFHFVCSGAKSEGVYEVHEGAIWLTYKKVDGEPVEFDSKKRLPLADDLTGFRVDTYCYLRASKQG